MNPSKDTPKNAPKDRNPRRGARRRPVGIPFLFLAIASASFSASAALSGGSIYNLDSRWTNQDGKSVSLSDLRGAPVLVTMVYTSCQGACPMTMSDLSRIEKSLPEKDRKRIRVAVFSFDSERDTPSALKKFAKAHGSDLSRWSFLHGSPSSVRKLAAVLGIRYKKDPSGDFEHSNAITLLDSGGAIVDRQIGLGKAPKEIVEKIEGLLRGSR